jgi:NADPH:quinone reductase
MQPGGMARGDLTDVPSFTLVLGTDGAGVIVGKRGLVRRFRVGDRVYAVDYSGRFYTEFVAPDVDNAARGPG